MKRTCKYIIGLLILCIAGCAENEIYTQTSEDGQYPVKLQANIDQLNTTRVDDSGFTDGDKIGIFMVDFENGIPGNLKDEGNRADNYAFTYNGDKVCWESSQSLFFKDASTPADFYGYYPYLNTISSVKSIDFSVERNQSTEAKPDQLSGYEKSDLLWAKTSGVSPTTPLINLTFNHILAGIEVNLIKGEGFTEAEWIESNKAVIVGETITDGVLDMSTGIAQSSNNSDKHSIIAKAHDNSFRAIVIPQCVRAGNPVMHINVGSDSYNFIKNVDMEYLSEKLHKFTFEVSKKNLNGDYEFNLVDESITVWESDPDSHDGITKEYLTVDIKQNQSLEEALTEAKINVSKVVNLKVTGFMIDSDFYYIRDNMKKIQALNLKSVKILDGIHGNSKDAIPSIALANCVTLKTIILPDKLERIEDYAFGGTILEGSLKIPNGVKYIGNYAFTNYWNENSGYSELPGGKLLANNNLTGSLELPSSLEYIGDEAFRDCNFTGTLMLPHSLKHVGMNAFNGCKNFTGEIHFPENLTEIVGLDWSDFNGDGAFYGMTGISGDLELPRNLKIINGFGGLNVTNILFPDCATEIGAYAFMNLNVKGSLIIPESVTSIGKYAFVSCSAPSISLPTSLTRISEGCFAACRHLCDTIKIPKNVEVIERCAFSDCSSLSAIELPAKLTYIADYAFENCFSLEYIHCAANEPPVVNECAFNGIAKDNFTLEVPEGSVDAYRNAPGWREFKRISAYRNFVARPSKYNVLNKGGNKEIILNADADWEMTDCPSWCHIDKTSGSKKTTLHLTVDAMAKGSDNRSSKITFKLKGSDHLTHINVGQYDYEYDEDSYVILQQASKGNGIDLFLLGDGYDAADISSGLLMKDMKQTMEYFFGVEPYTTYRDYFNVYTGIALSEDSGVEEINRWRTTKFHTRVPSQCGMRISADHIGAMDYCAEICPELLSKPIPRVGVILLANFTGYDGITYVGDSFCSLVTKSNLNYPNDARGLVQHEAGGHGVGWLADEYIYHNDFIQRCGCNCCEHVYELLSQQAKGFGLNVSLNGKYKDVDWTHLIFNPSYGNIVDIYEGGYFHQRGVYRSEYNSCMNNNIPYFSTWSRQLIVQRIMKLAGEEFSLEKFYANDKREMGQDFTTSRSRSNNLQPAHHSNPPVFIKNYTFGKKKGGKR